MHQVTQASALIRRLYASGSIIATADINREVALLGISHCWTPTNLWDLGVIAPVRRGFWRVA
jgi:hypothetical protein